MSDAASAALQRRQKLFDKELTLWTDDDLVFVLTARYEPSIIPPCRVCGGELSIQAAGGGKPTEWCCDGTEDDPDRPGLFRYKDGRRPADDHYVKSRYTDRRHGGDPVVMEMLRRFAATERGP